VIDVTWKLFSQTGNIEAYLLLKDLEDSHPVDMNLSHASEPSIFEDENNKVYKPH